MHQERTKLPSGIMLIWMLSLPGKDRSQAEDSLPGEDQSLSADSLPGEEESQTEDRPQARRGCDYTGAQGMLCLAI